MTSIATLSWKQSWHSKRDPGFSLDYEPSPGDERLRAHHQPTIGVGDLVRYQCRSEIVEAVCLKGDKSFCKVGIGANMRHWINAERLSLLPKAVKGDAVNIDAVKVGTVDPAPGDSASPQRFGGTEGGKETEGGLAVDHPIPKREFTSAKSLCLPAICEGGEVADRAKPTSIPLTDLDLTKAGFILPHTVNSTTGNTTITNTLPAPARLLQSDLNARASLVTEGLVAAFEAIAAADEAALKSAVEQIMTDGQRLLKLCGQTVAAVDCVVKDMMSRPDLNNECLQPGLGLEVGA